MGNGDDKNLTTSEKFASGITILLLCTPSLVTIWVVASFLLSSGYSPWFALPVSILSTAIITAFSISQQGNSLMECIIATVIVMVMALVLTNTLREGRDHNRKKKEQLERRIKHQPTRIHNTPSTQKKLLQ